MEPKHKRLLLVTTLVGLLPALVVLGMLRLRMGQLQVAGQAVAEYDLPRLFAAMISLMLPILLILPLAAGQQPFRSRGFWIPALTSPLALFGPSLIAGLVVGGRQAAAPLFALALLTLLHCCLCLWVALLNRLLDHRIALLTYGVVWAVSEYVSHLRLYVLPYLEIRWLTFVNYFNWLLPQVKDGPSLVDDYLQVGELALAPLAPTLIQMPLLLALLWFLSRKAPN